MTVKTETTKTVNIAKNIKVGEMPVKVVNASINTNDPENANLTHYIGNQELYKANRAEIRKAEAAAEDEIYAEQDKIIAEIGGVK